MMFHISVIIPAHNEASRIGRAIQSVLDQTRRVDEIIVVDDGSTDETLKVAAGFAGDIICVRQENLGVAAARNNGIRQAKHEWIAFLDADDVWQTDHIETACRVLQRHPDLVWFCQAIEKRDEEGRLLGRFGADESFERGDVILDYFDAEAKKHFSYIIGMLVKRRVFDEVGGFNEEIRQHGEDLDMWFRIALRYPRIGYAPGVGAIYLIRKGSLTSAGGPGLLARFLRRIEISNASVVSVPPADARRSEVLILAWVTIAIKASVRRGDDESLKEIQGKYRQLLPKKWRRAVWLLRCPGVMKIASLAYRTRLRWRRGKD